MTPMKKVEIEGIIKQMENLAENVKEFEKKLDSMTSEQQQIYKVAVVDLVFTFRIYRKMFDWAKQAQTKGFGCFTDWDEPGIKR